MEIPSPISSDALEGKHALVCGASAGIGRATAIALASAGAKLTLVARNANALEKMARMFQEFGAAEVHVVPLDLEDGDAIDSTLSTHLSTNGPIHILINNSGGPPSGPLLDADDEDFLKAIRRHLFASQRLVRMCLPGMEAESYGRIINIISTSVREPIPNLGVSNTVRGAMAGWSKTLASELPSSVTINNILPGFTDTGRLTDLAEQIAEKREIESDEVRQEWMSQVPAGRLIKPSETAAIITFLCTQAGGAIRGISLAVDGGRMRSI